MSEFDWAWPKRIDRPAVEAALRLDFLAEARNVVLVAPQGLGKTMIAQNIAHAAVLAAALSHVAQQSPRARTFGALLGRSIDRKRPETTANDRTPLSRRLQANWRE
jgi:MoxR-like ATPase